MYNLRVPFWSSTFPNLKCKNRKQRSPCTDGVIRSTAEKLLIENFHFFLLFYTCKPDIDTSFRVFVALFQAN